MRRTQYQDAGGMGIRAITKAHIHTGWEGLGFFRGVTWRPPTWNTPHQSAILSTLLHVTPSWATQNF